MAEVRKKNQFIINLELIDLKNMDLNYNQKYGVEVLGIDLASNMVGIAWERGAEEKNKNLNVNRLKNLNIIDVRGVHGLILYPGC